MTKATGPKYSRADLEEALRNLIRKGLVFTKVDEKDGRTRYFPNPLASDPEWKKTSLVAQATAPSAVRSVGRSVLSAEINREEDS
jgi:hypothetical protein